MSRLVNSLEGLNSHTAIYKNSLLIINLFKKACETYAQCVEVYTLCFGKLKHHSLSLGVVKSIDHALVTLTL